MVITPRYCGACGYKIDDPLMQFCSQCGERLQDTSQGGDGLSLAQAETGAETTLNYMPQEATGAWNNEPLVGFKPVHARMYGTGNDTGGNVSLVVSGIQFESGTGMERIPFTAITNVRMTRGMSTFGVTLQDGSMVEFKVYGAVNYQRTIQNVLVNPNVAHQGGIKGTPAQIKAKGGGLIAVGIICIVLVLLAFRIFNPLYAGGMIIVSIITIANGGKYIAAGNKAESMK